MEKQEPNYGLRPRRSTTKGKYREMLNLSSVSQDDCVSESRMEIANTLTESQTDILNQGCKIFILPSVIPDGDVITDNTIEIEISEGVSVSELDDLTTIEVEEQEKQTVKQENPLKHIDDILKQNDELIESISDGPSFKRRGTKATKDEVGLPKKNALQMKKKEDKSEQHLNVKGPKHVTMTSVTKLTLKIVQDIMLRSLTVKEEEMVEEFLKDGEPERVIDMLFGSEAENRLRKCYNCETLVKGSDSLYASHFIEVHECDPVYVCEFCGDICSDPLLYQSHLKGHFIKASLPNGQLLERRDSSELKEEDQDTTGEPFVCDICGKTLKHQKSLYSHRRTHTDAKAVCHICGATLKSSRYLHHHLLLHKDVEKPHKCDKCGKAFFSSSALKVHHYYNHEEHPGRFQCTICSKNFKAKQGLQFHMDSHSNELRYECSYCHKRFRGFKTCRVHELRHREANEPNKFSCSICSKQFKTRQTLKNHEDVHASFNRYQCSLCEKRFKLRKSCLAHIRVHHTDHERADNQQSVVPDEGEIAIESLLADGEEYVVTLEDSAEGGTIYLEGSGEETVELIVPEAHVECEVANVS